MELLHYFYNNKKYIINLNGDKLIFGVEKDNKEIDENLNQEEKIIMQSIYNYIYPNKNYLIRLSDISMSNNYSVYYNQKNGLYYFDSDNYSVKELNLLNYIFNNQSLYLYHFNKDEEKSGFQILSKINGVIVAIVVSGAILLSSIPYVPNNSALYTIDYKIDSLYKDSSFNKEYEHSIEDIMLAIKTNNNLTDQEKEFLYNIREELEDNIGYVDLDTVYQNLSELNIIYNPYYNPETNKTYEYSSYGNYCLLGDKKNIINLFGNEYYPTKSLSDSDQATLIHELQHLVNHRHFFMSSKGMPGEIEKSILMEIGVRTSVLEELLSEKFTREYAESFNLEYITKTYEWIMPAIYGLCEIVDTDALRKFKFNPDYYFIADNLLEKGIALETSHELFGMIENSHKLFGMSKKNKDNSDTNDLTVLVNYQNTTRRLYDLIKECYEKTHEQEMENDLVMLLYFYNTDFVDESFNRRVLDILGVEKIEKIIPKNYFSSKDMQAKASVTVVVDNELGETITIDDSNRYLKPYVTRF